MQARSVKVSIIEYANGAEINIVKSWGGIVNKVVELDEVKEYTGFLRQLYSAAGITMEITNAVS